MFALSAYVGLYAYSIFVLGMVELLSKVAISIFTGIWLVVGVILAAREKQHILLLSKSFIKTVRQLLASEPSWWIIIALLVGSFVVGLLGALGPELQHDALWYHLTLPKLYLQSGSIEFFSGDFLYYSGMPQLVEMLYIPALVFGNEIGAKLIHFGFGLLTTLVVVLISFHRWGIKAALISSLLVISDLSFGWASSTANIDLGRSFFELAGVYILVRWLEKPSFATIVKTGLLMGLALSTKYLSMASIGVMGMLILWYGRKDQKLQSITLFLLGVGAASIVWFVRAFYYTGNPVYPLFTHLIDNSYAPNPQSLWQWLQTPMFLSFDASLWDQAISPLFVLLLPVSALVIRKHKLFRLLSWYALLTFGAWMLMPRTGGTRFLLSYLPIWAILVGALWSTKSKVYSLIWMQRGAFALVIIITSINVLIRYKIHEKAIPVILGQQSKQEYLEKNLNLKTNIFDTNGVLASFVSDSDMVHVVGRANLYYAPFQVQHESYGNLDMATRVLVYSSQVPEYVTEKNLLYSDDDARFRLYKN